jgi:hypothetical protein
MRAEGISWMALTWNLAIIPQPTMAKPKESGMVASNSWMAQVAIPQGEQYKSNGHIVCQLYELIGSSLIHPFLMSKRR